MRVSFLVLLACLCLSAAANPGKKEKRDKEERSFVNDDGFNVQAEKSTVVSENTAVQTVVNGDCVEEVETTVIRTSVNGKRKGKRKKENAEVVIAPPRKTCDELLQSEKDSCAADHSNQKCNFQIFNEEDCSFECKCESIITEVVEEVVEEEGSNAGAIGEKKRRKIVKEGGEKRKKKKAGGKECAGEKKLSFSNCLLKMKGLIAWGEDTANIDARFAQM